MIFMFLYHAHTLYNLWSNLLILLPLASAVIDWPFWFGPKPCLWYCELFHFPLLIHTIVNVLSFLMILTMVWWPSYSWPLLNNSIQVLECFELQPDNSVFLELIPIFPKVDSINLISVLCSLCDDNSEYIYVFCLLCSLMLHRFLDLNFNTTSEWKSAVLYHLGSIDWQPCWWSKNLLILIACEVFYALRV